jgi:general secretion pathway protein F
LLAQPQIRRSRDRLLLGLPQLGKLIRMLEASRLARTLSGLMEGGVPLPDALAMASRAVNNLVIAQAIAGVATEVKEGGAVTSRIAATGVLPTIAIGFFRTGEETSQLAPMLGRLADVLERDITIRIERLVAVVTPVITIALGGAVAAIIASIMSAILGFNDLAVNQ